jgi:hypothetical protein
MRTAHAFSGWAGALLLTLSVPATASAALGGNVASVSADVVRMRGAVKRIGGTSAYAVHEIRAASGTIIREFVSPAGTVFGVAWQGPWHPDLRQLLGTYFDQYVLAARAARAGRSGHRPLVIRDAGLVVEAGGHPRAFAGRAFLTEMIPQGVEAAAIR